MSIFNLSCWKILIIYKKEKKYNDELHIPITQLQQLSTQVQFVIFCIPTHPLQLLSLNTRYLVKQKKSKIIYFINKYLNMNV